MSITAWIIYFISFLIFSGLLHRFFYLKSFKYSLKKANSNAERWSSQSKPVSGGITFYFMFLLSIIFFFFVFKNEGLTNIYVIPFFIIITLSFLMGLADDIINSSPYFKLFVQILSGVVLLKFGISIELFHNQYLNSILTVFWIVGIMNSINMIDNMDSISSIITISILLIVLFIIAYTGVFDVFVLMIILGALASLISFMFFNWHPAKMYMGDSGSQFIGALLALVGIIYFWNSGEIESFGEIRKIIIVLLAFLVPIIDTTTVTINRIMKGKSPFQGGRDHTTHHLSYMGMKERMIAIFLFTMSLISGLLSMYIILFIKSWGLLQILLFSAYILIVFTFLYTTTKIYKPKK